MPKSKRNPTPIKKKSAKQLSNEKEKRVQLKTDKRQTLVKSYVQVYGTSNAKLITELIKKDHGIGTKAETVGKDLKAMEADNQTWVRDLARTTWLQKTQQMYAETNLEIIQLQIIITKMMESEPSDFSNISKLIASTYETRLKRVEIQMKQEPENKDLSKEYAKLQRQYLADSDVFAKLLAQINITKTGGKIAYIQSIITEKRNYLAAMITDEPLYRHNAELTNHILTKESGT